jgi:putative DNA primase/helicase
LLEEKLQGHYRINERNEIIEKLKARNQTKREELNAGTVGKPVLCVGNGVVNFETGELEDHSPEFKFTRGIEYDYDDDRADKEAITDFLDSLTTRTEDRDTLLDHLAHGLMPGHPYRAFVITYGPGGNGKTQLGELFRGFVGSDNAAAVELQDLTGEDDFASGALPSAFVNIGDDVSVGEIRNTSILKTVTGGGTLRANEKHEKRYDFTNEAAMFFSANEPPRIAEDKQSIADRLYPIEMPYRFVDDPDPDNAFESQKVPGISEQLLEDDAAMRGLLALAVEHGHELVKSNGQYSMPEGPSGRRAIYEAASDPIQRFVLQHLEEGDGGDMILKDDAYSVYTQLCSRDNERPAAEDGFKRKISQQSIMDLESGQTRRLTPGDGAATCWKYVRFADAAKELMPDRLLERYFPGADSDESPEDGDVNDDDVASDEQQAFGAEPVRDAARSLTGYVTVTVEVVTTHRLGDSGAGVKAVVKDASGAMDVVSWEAGLGDQLEAHEDDCVVIQNAEVSEYDGSHQLTTVDGLTTISDIQRGVGYTNSENVEPAEEAVGSGKQSGLEESSQTTTTDGGEEYETAHPQIVDALRTNGEMSVPELAGRLGEDPSYIEDTVQSLSENGAIITEDNDGSLIARLD